MIIAELCQNHLGSKALLRRMTDAAIDAGAKIIKIQTFFAHDLSPAFEDPARIRDLELDWQTHASFVKWCTDRGAIPMTSVYTSKYNKELKDCGFNWIKVGSAQCQNQGLLDSLSKSFDNLVVSTGGTPIRSVAQAKVLNAYYLHCTSYYGGGIGMSNLFRMRGLAARFGFTGLSDHTDPTIPHWIEPCRAALGSGLCSMIEKHFTILPRDMTKDGPVSIDQRQLKELCELDSMFGIGDSDSGNTELIERYRNRWIPSE